jgi:uncharacterized protein
MADLDSAIFGEAVRRLVEEFQPEEILLFGSWAWGQPDSGSDVDLMVIVPESDVAPTIRARRAYACLRGIDAPFDILVKTRAEVDHFRNVKASLEYKIVEEGKVVYGRPSS